MALGALSPPNKKAATTDTERSIPGMRRISAEAGTRGFAWRELGGLRCCATCRTVDWRRHLMRRVLVFGNF
jgi:hypothetical protein